MKHTGRRCRAEITEAKLKKSRTSKRQGQRAPGLWMDPSLPLLEERAQTVSSITALGQPHDLPPWDEMQSGNQLSDSATRVFMMKES